MKHGYVKYIGGRTTPAVVKELLKMARVLDIQDNNGNPIDIKGVRYIYSEIKTKKTYELLVEARYKELKEEDDTVTIEQARELVEKDVGAMEDPEVIIVTDHARSTIINWEELRELSRRYPNTTIFAMTTQDITGVDLSGYPIYIVENEDRFNLVDMILILVEIYNSGGESGNESEPEPAQEEEKVV